MTTHAYDEDFGKLKAELERLLPLLLDDMDVSPEAYHAAQHALEWVTLSQQHLTTDRWNTICPFCKHKFMLEESPIECPACGHATDNWIGDDDILERLDMDLTTNL